MDMEKQIETTFWSKLVYVPFKAELRRPEGPQERSLIPKEVGNSCVYLQNQMVIKDRASYCSWSYWPVACFAGA